MPVNTKPTTAFSAKTMKDLRNAVRAMAQLQFNRVRQPVSIATLRQLFVPAELRDLLTNAYAKAAPIGSVFDLYVGHDTPFGRGGNQAKFRFKWDFGSVRDGFFVPHGFGNRELAPVVHYQSDADPYLRTEFDTLLTNLCDLSWRFGMVMHVLNKLNDANRTPAQLRFVWPAIVPLLRRAGFHADAEDIAEPSWRAGDSAKVPSELADYVKPAGDMVARATLVESKPLAAMNVRYEMSVTTFNHFDGLVWAN